MLKYLQILQQKYSNQKKENYFHKDPLIPVVGLYIC